MGQYPHRFQRDTDGQFLPCSTSARTTFIRSRAQRSASVHLMPLAAPAVIATLSLKSFTARRHLSSWGHERWRCAVAHTISQAPTAPAQRMPAVEVAGPFADVTAAPTVMRQNDSIENALSSRRPQFVQRLLIR